MHHNEAKFNMYGVYRVKGDIIHDFQNSTVQLIQLKPKHFFDFFYFFSK
jgi:hypothetical protein